MARKKKPVNKKEVDKKVKAFKGRFTNEKGVFQIKDEKGRFISKKAREAIIRKVRSTYEKGNRIDLDKIISSKTVQNLVETRTIEINVFTTSLETLLLSYKDQKNAVFIITGVNGDLFRETQLKKAILVVRDQNSILYEIIDLMLQSKVEVDSPQFSIPVFTKEDVKGNVRTVKIVYPDLQAQGFLKKFFGNIFHFMNH